MFDQGHTRSLTEIRIQSFPLTAVQAVPGKGQIDDQNKTKTCTAHAQYFLGKTICKIFSLWT